MTSNADNSLIAEDDPFGLSGLPTSQEYAGRGFQVPFQLNQRRKLTLGMVLKPKRINGTADGIEPM
ncbi:hypothetical protein SAMN05216417_1433 [Nitrosospira multiformis]|uniref:Uncharacterized protein n=1 Tax=Nitrosospira multiformis TaxID=1231 RepID=A0A1I7J270_9PROT|nr:hypothetical protein SAMN05216417_1433 [Nitrosospira multiformis]